MKTSENHTFKRGDSSLPYSDSVSPESIESLRILSFRLSLRPIRIEDAADVFREFTNKVAEYMTPEPAKKLEDTENFLIGAIGDRLEGKDLQLVITDSSGEEFLGLIGLHSRYGTQTPEVGVWLKDGAWGNGYGKKAVESLINWANTNMEFSHIVYTVAENNHPSRKIAESFTTTRSWAGPLALVDYNIPFGAEPQAPIHI